MIARRPPSQSVISVWIIGTISAPYSTRQVACDRTNLRRRVGSSPRRFSRVRIFSLVIDKKKLAPALRSELDRLKTCLITPGQRKAKSPAKSIVQPAQIVRRCMTALFFSRFLAPRHSCQLQFSSLRLSSSPSTTAGPPLQPAAVQPAARSVRPRPPLNGRLPSRV